MRAEGPKPAETERGCGTGNWQRQSDATGSPRPYQYVSFGFSSWDPPHIQGGPGYKEPRGGHCSILGSQPVDDQLGSALVSAEEDLQGPKVNARVGGFLGREEPQGCEPPAWRLGQPRPWFSCPLCSHGLRVSHVQGDPAQGRTTWLGEVLPSPDPPLTVCHRRSRYLSLLRRRSRRPPTRTRKMKRPLETKRAMKEPRSPAT